MPAIHSAMPELGTEASDFSLEDARQNLYTLENYRNKPLLIMFICNHCPYVIHIAPRMKEIEKFCREKAVPILAINSNDIGKYPTDSPENMLLFSEKYQFNFPYLFDETQEIAKAYQAECTPDFFLYDKDHKLFYRGQFDDSRPGNENPVTGEDLFKAIDLLSSGKKPPEKQKPSIGCSIKWRQD